MNVLPTAQYTQHHVQPSTQPRMSPGEQPLAQPHVLLPRVGAFEGVEAEEARFALDADACTPMCAGMDLDVRAHNDAVVTVEVA
eukprot:1326558-Pleurochrysis_carterae.AAC.1